MTEHSIVGGSSAHRWMTCPGSVALTKYTGGGSASPEADEGTEAHDYAALCLKGDTDPYMVDGCDEKFWEPVQVYLDYVRSRGAPFHIELPIAVHDLDGVFGTLDCVIAGQPSELVDYKHGVGVAVDATDNEQLLYYAYAWLYGGKDKMPVSKEPLRLTIVQPRGFHPDGIIRSWDVTFEDVWNWGQTQLRPGLERTYTEGYLSPGEHCRFCPAKLACPAFLGVSREAIGHNVDELAKLSPAVLSDLLAKAPLLRMMAVALEKEAYRRVAIEGDELPGWKVVQKKGDRVWKDDFLPQLEARNLWQPKKVMSPAMVEKIGPSMKKLVAEWAYQPDAGYIVVPESDKRKAVKVTHALDNYVPPE